MQFGIILEIWEHRARFHNFSPYDAFVLLIWHLWPAIDEPVDEPVDERSMSVDEPVDEAHVVAGVAQFPPI